MILGIGCDILEIARLEKLVKNNYTHRVFTEEERRQSEGKLSRLAGDFSVKEAVSKCFGTGVRNFSLMDIEVLRDSYGGAEKIFLEMGGKALHVSISNTKDLVMAYAVLEGEGF